MKTKAEIGAMQLQGKEPQVCWGLQKLEEARRILAYRLERQSSPTDPSIL